MNDNYYHSVNGELAMEFHLFTLEHPGWLEKHLPDGAIVVMQSDDPKFNAWALRAAKYNRARQKPRPPIVLVHIRKLRPRRSRIVQIDAEPLTPVKPRSARKRRTA